MAETIEELLEENLGKVQDLLTVSTQLESMVKQSLVPIDERTKEREKDLNEMISKMWSAKEILGVLDSALETSTGEVESRLDQIEKQCDSIGEKVEELDKLVDPVVQKLVAGETKLEAIRSDKYEATEKQLEQIRDTAKTLQTEIDKKQSTLTTSSTAYVEKVDGEFGALKQRYLNAVSSMNDFETQGTKTMDAAKQAMDQALEGVNSQLESVAEAFQEKIKEQIQQAAAEESAKVEEAAKAAILDAKLELHSANQEVQDAKNAVESEVSNVASQSEEAATTLSQAESGIENIKEKI